jgi:hypothetical protein
MAEIHLVGRKNLTKAPIKGDAKEYLRLKPVKALVIDEPFYLVQPTGETFLGQPGDYICQQDKTRWGVSAGDFDLLYVPKP